MVVGAPDPRELVKQLTRLEADWQIMYAHERRAVLRDAASALAVALDALEKSWWCANQQGEIGKGSLREVLAPLFEAQT